MSVLLCVSLVLCPTHSQYLRLKLYMKQAWAAMIHSARVSQKMAMLFFGRWPSAAKPLPN